MSRLYINSSLIVQAVEEKKQSLKKYCHGSEAAKIGKTEYLLACETLKYSEVLDNLFEQSKIDAVSLDVSISLFKVHNILYRASCTMRLSLYLLLLFFGEGDGIRVAVWQRQDSRSGTLRCWPCDIY